MPDLFSLHRPPPALKRDIRNCPNFREEESLEAFYGESAYVEVRHSVNERQKESYPIEMNVKQARWILLHYI